MHAKGIEMDERKEADNMEGLQNLDKEFFRSRGWEIKEGEGEYLLLLREEEILRGNLETMRQAEERIRYAMEAGELFGKTLAEVRAQHGYTREELAGIVLVPEAELRAIEEGQIYPDKITLQMIGNIYSVYADELENGRIVPKKTRDELHEMVKEIRNYVEIIRDDTKYFKEFMIKHDIPMQGENIEQMSSKGYPAAQEGQTEYFVVEDRATGRNVEDEAGKEIRMGSGGDAARIAELLNRGVEDGVTAAEVIRQYEQSIGRQDSTILNHEGGALMEYAASCQRYLRFGQDVERCLKGDIPNREAILVCQTPELYVQAGCNPLPMHITQRHLKNCLHEKMPGNAHYHGMTLQQIKRIPEELEAPAVLAESLTRDNALVSILGYKEQEGHPVIVSFVPDGKARYELEVTDSNFITSIYGRNNAGDFVGRLAEQDSILFIDKNRSEELALLPLQLRQGHHVPAYNCIIRQTEVGVKGKEKKEETLTASDMAENRENKAHEAGRQKEWPAERCRRNTVTIWHRNYKHRKGVFLLPERRAGFRYGKEQKWETEIRNR